MWIQNDYAGLPLIWTSLANRDVQISHASSYRPFLFFPSPPPSLVPAPFVPFPYKPCLGFCFYGNTDCNAISSKPQKKFWTVFTQAGTFSIEHVRAFILENYHSYFLFITWMNGSIWGSSNKNNQNNKIHEVLLLLRHTWSNCKRLRCHSNHVQSICHSDNAAIRMPLKEEQDQYAEWRKSKSDQHLPAILAKIGEVL